MKTISFDILPSTQTYIKENINILEEYTYVIAKTQTNGRGRTGNEWVSHSENLMFSFYVNPSSIKQDHYALITLLTGFAVRLTLSQITQDDRFLIKWPNDIIYEDKKVCGIIAEGIVKNNQYLIVIGIGINVNQMQFCESIKNKATSLKIIKNKTFDMDEILATFDINFKNFYHELEQDNLLFIDSINHYNYLKEKKVRVNNPMFVGKEFECLKINSEGFLVLKDGEKEITLNANEVTLSKNYKCES